MGLVWCKPSYVVAVTIESRIKFPSTWFLSLQKAMNCHKIHICSLQAEEAYPPSTFLHIGVLKDYELSTIFLVIDSLSIRTRIIKHHCLKICNFLNKLKVAIRGQNSAMSSTGTSPPKLYISQVWIVFLVCILIKFRR